MNFKDLEGVSYGRIYGTTDGANFGLIDGDGDWSFRSVKDGATYLYSDNQISANIGTGGLYLRADRIE